MGGDQDRGRRGDRRAKKLYCDLEVEPKGLADKRRAGEGKIQGGAWLSQFHHQMWDGAAY